MTTPDFEPQLSVDLAVEGQGEGPVVCVVSGMQSGDVTGTTVLQSLLKNLDPKHIKGTLILCPSFVPAQAQNHLTMRKILSLKKS